MSHHTDTRETRNFAREIKFLLDASTARAVRDWARANLHADLHGAGSDGDEYDISTLYFDTDQFDVFHRRGSFGRSKYRIRRYGTSDVVFFERKMRNADRLVKRRTALGIDEMACLASDVDDTWPARWFHERIKVRRIQPTCRVSYHRTARVGMTSYGPMRLTLDDHLVANATRELAFGGATGTPVGDGAKFLELKYPVEVPAIFKRLLADFSLVPRPVSKYRLSIAALGLATADAGVRSGLGGPRIKN